MQLGNTETMHMWENPEYSTGNVCEADIYIFQGTSEQFKVSTQFEGCVSLSTNFYISYKGNSGFAPASRTVCFGFDLLRLAAKTKTKVIILSHQPYCRLLIIEDPDQFYVQIEIHDSANEHAAMYALTIMIWTIIHC